MCVLSLPAALRMASMFLSVWVCRSVRTCAESAQLTHDLGLDASLDHDHSLRVVALSCAEYEPPGARLTSARPIPRRRRSRSGSRRLAERGHYHTDQSQTLDWGGRATYVPCKGIQSQTKRVEGHAHAAPRKSRQWSCRQSTSYCRGLERERRALRPSRGSDGSTESRCDSAQGAGGTRF
jgi:hypothetical protein